MYLNLQLKAKILIYFLVLIVFSTYTAFPGIVIAEADVMPNFPSYPIVPLNHVLTPRIAQPYLVVHGQEFDVWIAKSEGMAREITWSVSLESIFTETGKYHLELLDQGFSSSVNAWWISVSTPVEVPPGLYNLTVSGGGYKFTEPNSVYVFGDSFPNRITVLHLADTCFGTREMAKHYSNQALFRDMIATINALKPDIVAVSGDFIDGIASKNDEEFYRAAYKYLLSLRVPFTAVLGGTDYTANEHGFTFWEEYFAPFYGVIDIGPYFHLIRLDSDEGKVMAFNEQKELIYRLMQGKEGVNFVVTHEPPIEEEVMIWNKLPNGKFERLSHDETVKELLGFFHSLNVSLVLGGDLHRDHIETLGEPPVINLVTNAAQYDEGEWFYEDARSDSGHYRPITLYSNGELEYRDVSPCLAEFGVSYLNWPDGSSSGLAVSIWNKEKEAKSIEIPVVLSTYSDKPIVEGAEVVASYNSSSKGVYILHTSVQPGEEKIIKIYIKPDTVPPKAKITPELKENRLTLKYKLSDKGLGVLRAKFYYSNDNKTWIEIKPTYKTGYPNYIVESPKGLTYYKVIVEGAAGNKATYHGKTGRVKTPLPSAAPQSIVKSLSLIILVVTAAALTLLAIILLKKKK